MTNCSTKNALYCGVLPFRDFLCWCKKYHKLAFVCTCDVSCHQFQLSTFIDKPSVSQKCLGVTSLCFSNFSVCKNCKTKLRASAEFKLISCKPTASKGMRCVFRSLSSTGHYRNNLKIVSFCSLSLLGSSTLPLQFTTFPFSKSAAIFVSWCSMETWLGRPQQRQK